MSSAPEYAIFLEEEPVEEFEIRPPSPPPVRPSATLLPMLLPAVFMGLSAVAMLIVALTNAATPAQLLMNFTTVGFMLMSVLTAWLNHRLQQQEYERSLVERRQRYMSYLRRRESELEELMKTHVLRRRTRYLRASECYQTVLRREAALWQRDVRHVDFLVLRVGLGTVPSPIKVKLQEPDPNQPQDELFSEAERIKQKGQVLEDAPIVLPLSTFNVIGIVGSPSDTHAVASNWIVQISALHAPGSVYIAAMLPLGSQRKEGHWHWLRWVPHVWTPGRARSLLATAARDVQALAEQLQELGRNLNVSASTSEESRFQPHIVVFADLDTLPSAANTLRPLITTRPNVHLVVLASNPALLPRECNWIIECGASAVIRRVQPTANANVRLDEPIQPSVLELFAETLMRYWERESLSEEETRADTSTVTLLQLWEDGARSITSVHDINIAEAWQRNLPFERTRRTLAVPIGRDENGALVYLNLHDREDPSGQPSHGPHGLVAGATGSGKSELLQSLVASLAAHFSPEVLSFLLVDYKGGGTADVFREMPHVAGIITNLADESLTQRALLALQSEVQRRQEYFQLAGVNYIDDYQRQQARDRNLPPLPRLVIIVDEFAELAQNQPEFIRQLVRTARIGRSLGVHLILATQKPSGVVNDQIWSNSRFRICLRVESPADSNDMLKRPDAASLTRSGQAYLQVGSGEIFLRFQAAYANAPYIEGAADLIEPVFEVDLDGSRRQLSASRTVQQQSSDQTQLRALVAHICDTAKQLNLRPVEPIWIPPLPDPKESEHALALLSKTTTGHFLTHLFYPAGQGWEESEQRWHPPERWLSPLVGLVDDPRNRLQEPLHIPLGNPPAHLLVYGMPSSGKTTFLLTLAISLVLDHTPEELNIYALDFGARALTVLASFPHTADVIQRGEAEKVTRLFRILQAEADRRRQLFAEVGVSSFLAYLDSRKRNPAQHVPLPAIVVLIDGYPTFLESHPEQDAQLEQLMRECAGQGIHFVIAGGSAMSIKPRIAANAALAVTFQQADPSDYSSIVGRASIRPAPLPGRGLVRRSPPLEFQTALPVRAISEAERTELLHALGERMRRAWRGPTPCPVPTLPDVLPLCDLLKLNSQPASDQPPIALTTDMLIPLSVSLEEGSHFLIFGPPQGGKTTLLMSWLIALAEWHSPESMRLFLCDLSDFPEDGLGMLRGLPHCAGFAQNPSELELMLASLSEEVAKRRARKEQLQDAPALIFALDNLSRLAKAPPAWLAEHMLKIVQHSKGAKVHLIIAANEEALGRMYNQEWLDLIRGQRSGFLVGASQTNAVNLRMPPGESQRSTPPGFGYFSTPRRPLAVRVKFATPFVGALALPEWVTQIAQRYANCASIDNNQLSKQEK